MHLQLTIDYTKANDWGLTSLTRSSINLAEASFKVTLVVQSRGILIGYLSMSFWIMVIVEFTVSCDDSVQSTVRDWMNFLEFLSREK